METEGSVVSFIDIGTNSVRLLVVRINANGSYRVLRQDKEVVRLGEKEYENGGSLHKDAMDRAVLVCRRFAGVAKALGSEKMKAMATSATRDAANQEEFLSRLKKEAGLDVRVISGREEARLVYLGMASGVHIGEKNVLFVDLGGGSTEIAIGNQHCHLFLDCLELGAIRITSMYLKDGGKGPVSGRTYRKIKLHAKNKMLRASEEIRRQKITEAYGGSGTIQNLAEMAAKVNGKEKKRESLILRLKDLKRIARLLCSKTLEERKRTPGLNPYRADIIIGGAAILETLMEEFGIKEIKTSDRGLLHGMLMDEISRRKGFPQPGKMSVRDWSVLQLARSCNYQEKHASAVTLLAIELFDSAKRLGLHSLDAKERELLKYAAILHDVGDFISFTDHNLHSHYIIKNSQLLGFDQQEIDIIANVALYHRKKAPKRKEIEGGKLDAANQETVVMLSAILRLAENLDRSRTNPIKKARFTSVGKKETTLTIWSDGDCELEKWGIESVKGSFEKAYCKRLVLRVIKNQQPRAKERDMNLKSLLNYSS